MVFYVFLLLTMTYLWLAGARRHRLRVGSTSLVYYRMGPQDGEPWVLLHGLGSVAASWGPVLRHLRRDCDLIVPELSVLGGSKIESGGLGVRQGAEVVARDSSKFLEYFHGYINGIARGLQEVAPGGRFGLEEV